MMAPRSAVGTGARAGRMVGTASGGMAGISIDTRRQCRAKAESMAHLPLAREVQRAADLAWTQTARHDALAGAGRLVASFRRQQHPHIRAHAVAGHAAA